MLGVYSIIATAVVLLVVVVPFALRFFFVLAHFPIWFSIFSASRWGSCRVAAAWETETVAVGWEKSVYRM